MKAMILAAGLGSRMRPLTNSCPKPLLKVAGKALIDYHLERLAKLNVSEVVINTHWLSEQLHAHVNKFWSNRLCVHMLDESSLLETAGGVVNALPFLDNPRNEPFLLVNGDVFVDSDLTVLINTPLNSDLAHLLLCANPSHNLKGDFSLRFLNEYQQPRLTIETTNTHTYSGLGLFRPSLFRKLSKGKRALGPILKQLALGNSIQASELPGYWIDVGTPTRLKKLEKHIKKGK